MQTIGFENFWKRVPRIPEIATLFLGKRTLQQSIFLVQLSFLVNYQSYILNVIRS